MQETATQMNLNPMAQGVPGLRGSNLTMPPDRGRSHTPVRVFLIEDSPVIRDRLTEGLNLAGRIEVIGHAETASAALAFLNLHECEVIILDLDLKQSNGLQVLTGLRSGNTDHRPLIIMFTSYVLPQYRNQSMRLGADYFFDKARDFERVLQVVESIVPPTDAGAPPVS